MSKTISYNGRWIPIRDEAEYEVLLQESNIRWLKDPGGQRTFGFDSLVDGMEYTSAVEGPARATEGPPSASYTAGPANPGFRFPAPPNFSDSVARVFRLYPSGLFGCCGTAVAISKQRLLSANHPFEDDKYTEDGKVVKIKYQGPVVVFIASQLLTATIIVRSVRLDAVELVLDKPCDTIVSLAIANSRQIPLLAPVVLAHFPLFHDNSYFRSYRAIVKQGQLEGKIHQDDPSIAEFSFSFYKGDRRKNYQGKGMTFLPGRNVPPEPLLTTGVLGATYLARSRGFANYQSFQNSSGGAVLVSSPEGWLILGIHLGVTSDIGDSTHMCLAQEQLDKLGIKEEAPPKRAKPAEDEAEQDTQSLASEDGNFDSKKSPSENLGYFSFADSLLGHLEKKKNKPAKSK